MQALIWSLFGLRATFMTAGFAVVVAGFRRLGDHIDETNSRIDGLLARD